VCVPPQEPPFWRNDLSLAVYRLLSVCIGSSRLTCRFRDGGSTRGWLSSDPARSPAGVTALAPRVEAPGLRLASGSQLRLRVIVRHHRPGRRLGIRFPLADGTVGWLADPPEAPLGAEQRSRLAALGDGTMREQIPTWPFRHVGAQRLGKESP